MMALEICGNRLIACKFFAKYNYNSWKILYGGILWHLKFILSKM